VKPNSADRTGSTAQWITLGDALRHVCEVMNTETRDARLVLLMKLARGEIVSRAFKLRTADRRVDITLKNWIETKSCVDPLRAEFWSAEDVKIAWSDNSARSSDADRMVIKRASDIELRKADLYRDWPPPLTVALSAPPRTRKPNLSHAELDKFLAKLDGKTTEPEAYTAAKKEFPDHEIPRSLWRSAWRDLPETKKRRKGENARTLKSKSAG